MSCCKDGEAAAVAVRGRKDAVRRDSNPRRAESHQLGRGIAKECRQSTAPTDIKHQASQSGGSSTFRGAADVPDVPAKIMLIPVFEFPVRSAKNCVASGFKWYALT
jgi:hypothetical protein